MPAHPVQALMREMAASSVAYRENIDRLRKELAAFGVDSHFGDGCTPLVWAAYLKHHTMCGMLLEEFGANPSKGGAEENVTPLMEACLHGDLELVNMLLAAGADMGSVSNAGYGCLVWCFAPDRERKIRNIDGRIAVAYRLIDAGYRPRGHRASGADCDQMEIVSKQFMNKEYELYRAVLANFFAYVNENSDKQPRVFRDSSYRPNGQAAPAAPPRTDELSYGVPFNPEL